MLKRISNLSSSFYLIQPKRSHFLLRTSIFTFAKYNKASIHQELITMSTNLPPNISSQDYTQLANNYIQLTQKSFYDYVRKEDIDSQILLMFLSTFEDQKKIRQFLPVLYNKINYLEAKEILHLMEKILAFKPSIKPKIPHPKPLEQIQSILIILSQLYKNDYLVEWLKYIPVYKGEEYYILSMGFFSIMQKMSHETKANNINLLVKCHQKIANYLMDESVSVQCKTGIILLALQSNYKQALYLFLLAGIDIKQPLQKILFWVNLNKYLTKNQKILKDYEQGSPQQKNMKIVQQINKQFLQNIVNQDYQNFLKSMKIQIFLQIWKTIQLQTKLDQNYLQLIQKLSNVVLDKKFKQSMKSMQTSQLLIIIQCMQKHKVSNKKMLKYLLVLFSKSLQTMNKKQLVRLMKCLVTYVRQFEEYLINVRNIVENRKLQYNQREINQINQILRRVMVLFPKPLVYGS